jgi:CheY-like chemotaxis protein
VLTALVVDDSSAARKRMATLLRLAGWEVHQAVGAEAALSVAARVRPDLVVTDMIMRGGNGAALLHRLRNEGCRARTVVVATNLTEQVREYAAAAGAMACLAKPVDPRELLDVMHTLTGNAVRPAPRTAPQPIRIDAERLDHVRERYASDLPLHLSAIAASAQDGDATAVAAGARMLADASEQVGRDEVAWVCRGIAGDAHRGVVSHFRLMQLVALSAASDRGTAALGQATGPA